MTTGDPLIDGLMARANQKIREDAREQGILTINDLRIALMQVPAETPVVVDNDGKAPASLGSYRGYYERLGIDTHRWRDDYKTEREDGGDPFDDEFIGHYEPGANEVRIAEPVNAAEMLKALDLVVGHRFEGYKGGQYLMDGSTFLHVAPHGSTGVVVVGTRVVDGMLAILTEEEKWD